MNQQPVLAIDLGGTEIKVGIVSGAKVLSMKCIPAFSDKGLAAALERVETSAEECLIDAGLHEQSLMGLSMAFAGVVDCDRQKAIGANGKYDDAASVDVSAWARDRWGLELVLDNDARMATVGEWKFGAGTGVDDLVVVTLGTGIGTGVIIDSQALVGSHNRAGILGGHFPVSVESDVQCSCGNRACAESLASTWALQRELEARPVSGLLADTNPQEVGFKELFQAVEKGDAAATAIAHRMIRVWSTLVVALIHAYDPDRVVLTGNVMKSADAILPDVRSYVNRYAWTPGCQVSVERGEHPETAALIGGGHFVSQKMTEQAAAQ